MSLEKKKNYPLNELLDYINTDEYKEAMESITKENDENLIDPKILSKLKFFSIAYKILQYITVGLILLWFPFCLVAAYFVIFKIYIYDIANFINKYQSEIYTVLICCIVISSLLYYIEEYNERFKKTFAYAILISLFYMIKIFIKIIFSIIIPSTFIKFTGIYFYLFVYALLVLLYGLLSIGCKLMVNHIIFNDIKKRLGDKLVQLYDEKKELEERIAIKQKELEEFKNDRID